MDDIDNDLPEISELTGLAAARHRFIGDAAVIARKVLATMEEAPPDIQAPYHPITIIPDIVWALHGNPISARANDFLCRLAEFGDERVDTLQSRARWQSAWLVDLIIEGRGDYPLADFMDDIDIHLDIDKSFTTPDYRALVGLMLAGARLAMLEVKPVVKLVRSRL